jgi:NAD(P)-dependent dehydrogenase (short-subunit alcohol dehydrogenase family)
MISSAPVGVFLGATSGIGQALAIEFAHPGTTVVIVGRNEAAARTTVKACQERGADATYLLADLSLIEDTKRLAARIRDDADHITLMAHAADMVMSERKTTDEGIESQFAVNYLSRYTLNALLFDLVRAGAPAQIIHVAAPGTPGKLSKSSFPPAVGGVAAHTIGQLSNDIYALSIFERLQGTGVTIRVINPGIVDTGFRGQLTPQWKVKLIEALLRPITKSCTEAARRIYRLQGKPSDNVNQVLYGMFGFRPMKPRAMLRDEQLQADLLSTSEELTGIKPLP